MSKFKVLFIKIIITVIIVVVYLATIMIETDLLRQGKSGFSYEKTIAGIALFIVWSYKPKAKDN
ncbi:MAG: hypothetical protein R2774_01950 [Saprospiraceae bacterium]